MSSIALTADEFRGFGGDKAGTASIFSEQAVEKNETDVGRVRVPVATSVSSYSNIQLLQEDSEIQFSFVQSAEKTLSLSGILNKIDAIEAVGDDWNEEGVKGPNAYVLDLSRELARQFVDNDIYPITVTQTIEEGASFVFKNSTKMLYLEIYNDKEMGIITEDFERRQILSNKQIESQVDVVRELTLFFNT